MDKYNTLIARSDFFHDAAQMAAVEKLEELRLWLESRATTRKGLFSGLLGRRAEDVPHGLYLWGGVGAGKSMLMDLFFEATNIQRKRRVHFHAFMQEVHAGLHEARATGHDDPIAPVAEGIAEQARLLCFDEMQITDITDAMIVGRLFEKLMAAGTSIVTTSNRAPDDLYRNGLNRQLFLPFIELIKARMVVHHLFTDVDYRQDRLRGRQTWFTPADATARAALDDIWNSLTEGVEAPLALKVGSRKVTLPRFHNGAARSTFAELCDRPLGPADFLALTEAVRVLVIDDIPRLSRARNNEARRFVTLIDAAYEAGTRLFCSAEAEPEELYATGPGAFEFERTASRLREMQSADWAGPDQ
ncbi:MAG: AFG1 family ATPase [Rhodobacteraceae bacterium]|nr:AFG1 family ATPase [Paracoccaceae bacterium]